MLARAESIVPTEEPIKNYATSPWTDEATTYLKEKWPQGSSAREIAAHLGMTRSAVIGRAHRLGIQRKVDYVFWTPQQIEKLTQLWNEHFSAQQIAERLCREFDGKRVCKSTVLHKARRLGLYRRKRTAESYNTNRAPRLSRPRVPYATIIDTDIPADQRRTFAQLERGECKWPIGDPDKPDFFFCGGEAFGSGPYCSAHHHRAYGIDPGKFIPKGRFGFGAR